MRGAYPVWGDYGVNSAGRTRAKRNAGGYCGRWYWGDDWSRRCASVFERAEAVSVGASPARAEACALSIAGRPASTGLQSLC